MPTNILNSSQFATPGYLQLASGALDTSVSNGTGFDVVAIRILPGSTFTLALNALHNGQMFGNGGYPAIEYFTDNAGAPGTYLSAATVAAPVADGGLWTAPSDSTVAWMRVQFGLSNSSDFVGSFANTQITTPTPYVPPATPALAFSISPHYLAAPPFAVAATSNSPGAITYALLSGPATLSGSTVTLTGVAGTVVVQASQAAAPGFLAATQSASFAVTSTLPTPNGFTLLTAARIQNSGGILLSGNLQVTPTDAKNVPVASVAGGIGGPVVDAAVFPFTAGVLAPNSWVPDSSATTNPWTSYRFTFLRPDGSTYKTWYTVQPTGPSLNLDTYQPKLADPQAIQVPGLPGQSAYQIAVAGGYTGTQAQWLASLQGAPGGLTSQQVSALIPPAIAPAIAAQTAIVGPAAVQAALALMPRTLNLFDPTRATLNQLLNTADGSYTAQTNFYVSDFMPVVPGKPYTMALGDADTNPAFGLVWFDIAGNRIGAVGFPFTGPQTFVAIPNAFWARFCSVADITKQMFLTGTTVPSSYLPFFGAIPTTASLCSLAGKRFGVWGNSISRIFGNAYQNVILARTGMILAFQNSRPGARTDQSFEFYGGLPTGTNQGTVSTPNGNWANTGTPGNTLAQDLAGLDFMFCEMGTNDSAILQGAVNSSNSGYPGLPSSTPPSSLGALGDPVTANTLYGYINQFDSGVLTANPNLSLIKVGAYNSPSVGSYAVTINAALAAVGAVNGTPVYNSYTQVGIGPHNWSTMLLSDGLHPSPLGFSKLIGPRWAQFCIDNF